MKRAAFLLFLALVGCQATRPVALPAAPASAVAAQPGMATLTFAIAWPRRAVQTIPLSALSVRIRVFKDQTKLGENLQKRSANSASAHGAFSLNADTGLTVRAEAFETQTPTDADAPIASAEKTDIALYANQRTSLSMSLVPAFVPEILTITPSNGGPGVPVTLTGTFGAKGPYAAFLGEFTAIVDDYGSGTLKTTVPENALSGGWVVRANGVTPDASGSFKVIKTLMVAPDQPSAQVGGHLTFAATGFDTEGSTVSAPTLTAWDVVDPQSEASTSVGRISATGRFDALAPGTAQIRAFSGSVVGMTTVTVE